MAIRAKKVLSATGAATSGKVQFDNKDRCIQIFISGSASVLMKISCTGDKTSTYGSTVTASTDYEMNSPWKIMYFDCVTATSGEAIVYINE